MVRILVIRRPQSGGREGVVLRIRLAWTAYRVRRLAWTALVLLAAQVGDGTSNLDDLVRGERVREP